MQEKNDRELGIFNVKGSGSGGGEKNFSKHFFGSSGIYALNNIVLEIQRLLTLLYIQCLDYLK